MFFKVQFPCIFPIFPCITSFVISYHGKLMQYKIIKHMARKASSGIKKCILPQCLVKTSISKQTHGS